jgi:hypothetical protein
MIKHKSIKKSLELGSYLIEVMASENVVKLKNPWGWVSSKISHNEIFWMLHWWVLFHSGPLIP